MLVQYGLSSVRETLQSKGLRVTTVRINILKYLAHKNSPECLESIWKGLKKYCDQATIFRNLREFLRVGLIEVHHFGDRKNWYSLALHRHGHKHYLRCHSCPNIVEITDCKWFSINSEIERQFGYKAVSHQLEFTGQCPECQIRESP